MSSRYGSATVERWYVDHGNRLEINYREGVHMIRGLRVEERRKEKTLWAGDWRKGLVDGHRCNASGCSLWIGSWTEGGVRSCWCFLSQIGSIEWENVGSLTMEIVFLVF